jgi:predicted lipoprotein
VRDATGLVPFTNFTTQLQYADVGNALNEIVLKSVLNPLASRPMPGRSVEFVATFAAQASWQPPIRDAIPVQLAVDGSHP